MFKPLLTFALAACIAPCSALDGWLLDDAAVARKQAVEEGKGVIIAFTGSDWCGPCMQLKKETLGTADFIANASADFVLLELDFPRRRPQGDEVKAANRQIAAQYKVPGYPMMVFTDAQGNLLESFAGYRPKHVVEKKLADARTKLKGTEGSSPKPAATPAEAAQPAPAASDTPQKAKKVKVGKKKGKKKS